MSRKTSKNTVNDDGLRFKAAKLIVLLDQHEQQLALAERADLAAARPVHKMHPLRIRIAIAESHAR
jgi:hypothetical protein